jgi:hypothetical protein
MMRAARLAALPAFLLPTLFAASILVAPLGQARAEDAVSVDNPVLISKANDLCLEAALVSGGIDKVAKTYCACMAPVLARHMTPGSRRLMLTETHDYIQPAYDDPQALYDDALKSCPAAKP